MIKKTVLFSVLLSSAVVTSNSAQAGQIYSILDCTKITVDENRLSCFDAAAEKLLNAVIGQNSVQEVKPAKQDQAARFGKSQLRSSPVKAVREKEKLNKAKEPTSVTLKVVKHTYTATKKFVLFMENGQVWKQNNGGRIPLPKGEFEVEIKKGMLGGYNMIVPTKKSIIKVKRLK